MPIAFCRCSHQRVKALGHADPLTRRVVGSLLLAAVRECRDAVCYQRPSDVAKRLHSAGFEFRITHPAPLPALSSHVLPRRYFWEGTTCSPGSNLLILLVGAPVVPISRP